MGVEGNPRQFFSEELASVDSREIIRERVYKAWKVVGYDSEIEDSDEPPLRVQVQPPSNSHDSDSEDSGLSKTMPSCIAVPTRTGRTRSNSCPSKIGEPTPKASAPPMDHLSSNTTTPGKFRTGYGSLVQLQAEGRPNPFAPGRQSMALVTTYVIEEPSCCKSCWTCGSRETRIT